MMIAGFILSILTMVVIMVGFVMPRYYDAFIPIHRREEGTEPTVAMETKGELAGKPIGEMVNAERGHGGIVRDSSSDHDAALDDDKAVKGSVIR
jgi:solute carrier family 6 GABA transporter-like protein 1